MREIKCRANDKLTNQWVYANGYYFDGINYWFTLPNKKLHVDKAIAWAEHILVIPETIGEYTGLKDKNGVEIYEGDIVKQGNFFKFKVKWDSNNASWGDLCCEQCVINVKEGLNTRGNMPTIPIDYFEIIGNIYENKELVKQ